jgi:hypothetical protein
LIAAKRFGQDGWDGVCRSLNNRRIKSYRGASLVAADSNQKASSANPTVVAMDHPITTLMVVVGLISLGILAYGKMRVDIFPSLNTPRIYIFIDFIGMSPDQIEGFIANELELYFQYVDGVQDIKSRNIQQVGLLELGFFHDTDMGQAMAQVVAMSDRALAWMPPGSLPPLIMRMDAGSVPIGYLVFTSEGDKTSLGGDGRLGAEHHPPAGAEKCSRHGRHLPLWPEHAVNCH